jgi:hypothetical protein
MPDRRIRTSSRAVKHAISKYDASGVVRRAGYTATISIGIISAPDP